MGRRSNGDNQWANLRDQIIGLGERSIRKSYYPQLRERLSELERFRQLLDQIHDLMVIFEVPSGRICDVNRSTCTILEYDKPALLQLTLPRVCPELTDIIGNFHQIEKKLDKVSKPALISNWMTRNGQPVPVEATVQIDRGVGAAHGIVVGRQIADRLQAERVLKESEAKYRALIEATGTGFVILDERGHVIDANLEYLRLSGHQSLEQIKDQSTLGWIGQHQHPLWQKAFDICLHGGTIKNLEFDFIDRAGRITPVEIHATLMKRDSESMVLTLCWDITERRWQQAERQKMARRFQDAQRFESIGTLAGGIAHDFNNLLMGVQGRASLMLLDSNRPAKDFEHLKGIEAYVKSAAELTHQLLGLAKGGKYQVLPTDINELTRQTALMFGRTKKEVRIHERYAADLATAAVDRGQIEQVLLNLFINAWQAMPDGGNLSLETANVDLDGHYVAPFGLKPGRFVRISVTDSGIGMDEKTRRRVFEPFFTTRAMSRGTGLGLASAYGIVTNHAGMITVYSEPGHGSTFNVYLPASGAPAPHAPSAGPAIQRGSETLLIVDDEQIILHVAAEMLTHLGYRVLSTDSGDKAIEMYKANLGKVDLVILDMIMPKMGGGAVFDQLKKIDPKVKVILSSGYALSSQATEILDRGCRGFIQKPYDLTSLSKKVREAL